MHVSRRLSRRHVYAFCNLAPVNSAIIVKVTRHTLVRDRLYHNRFSDSLHHNCSSVSEVHRLRWTPFWSEYITADLPVAFLTRFNKIAIQGTIQMAVDKEALICLSRVYSYYFKCNLPLFYVYAYPALTRYLSILFLNILTLLSVTRYVVVWEGWSLVRVVVRQGFYCTSMCTLLW